MEKDKTNIGFAELTSRWLKLDEDIDKSDAQFLANTEQRLAEGARISGRTLINYSRMLTNTGDGQIIDAAGKFLLALGIGAAAELNKNRPFLRGVLEGVSTAVFAHCLADAWGALNRLELATCLKGVKSYALPDKGLAARELNDFDL